jgi:hypothetical protein
MSENNKRFKLTDLFVVRYRVRSAEEEFALVREPRWLHILRRAVVTGHPSWPHTDDQARQRLHSQDDPKQVG